MTAPRWFFRFIYDRESAAWERRRDQPEHRDLVERIADELANVVAPPGPVADLGCGPGAHALALARRGYTVVGRIGDRCLAPDPRGQPTAIRMCGRAPGFSHPSTASSSALGKATQPSVYPTGMSSWRKMPAPLSGGLGILMSMKCW
jgi:hypothetical protein